ncbi:hypothetical protein GIB67_013907 [Kingdonia uniflora]|uniref:Uncharacterized protein n=1 Tax=Kingdonia uniflora TaxID=39325 RepID=A0A7J7LDL7_9MAGN|nr:hypothetical protein GIB67_013907 [Kingdonia uniflora]
MMMKPRCGRPDIVDGKTPMQSEKKSHLHTVSHYSFLGNRWRACNTIFPNIDNYKPEDLSRRSIADGLQASNTDLEHKPEEDSRRYHKHFRWNNGSKHSSRSRPIKGHCNFIVLEVTVAVQRSNFIQLHSSRTSDLEDI